MELVTIEAALDAVETDLLAVPLFQGELGPLEDAGGGLAKLAAQAQADGFSGKRGEVAVLPTFGLVEAKRIACVGLGPREKFRPADLRGAVAAASSAATSRGAATMAVWIDPLPGDEREPILRFAAEGAVLAGHRFSRYRSGIDNDDKPPLARVALIGQGLTEPSAALERGRVIASAVCFARDLVSEPPSVCTPHYLVDKARELAADGALELTTVEGLEALEAADMAMFAAVSRGSEEPPALIHLTYRPSDRDAVDRRVALVGKGVTYDSGGYSLKPPASQVGMHGDMAGAAAVLGAAKAVADLRPAGVEVHFVVPASENLVSGRAYKVNDIVKSKSGKTVEVVNTDAEGRLLLGDALAYAEAIGVDAIVDIATLTGANVIALGGVYAALYASDDDLAERFLSAADGAGELFWRMPLPDRLDKKLKSPVADLKNSGGRTGSSITAALFLKNFVTSTPWIHIDMAGLGIADEAWEHIPKGATGFAVATLARFATGG